MTSREEALKNPIFPALKKVGQTPEGGIYPWAHGLCFHNQNLLNGLRSNVADASLREAILSDLWSSVHSIVPERVSKVLGIEAEPNVDKINKLLSDIDERHPAIKAMGDSIEEALVNWLKAFTLFDWSVYTYLEKHLGAKDALKIYMGLWESFALGPLEEMKKTFGIVDKADIDMDAIGKLSRAYWESIGAPYRVTQHDKDIHEAEIEVCAYYEVMKDVLGEGKARSMTLKTEAVVSVNYYDAILKALGVFDKFSFTMDKFACCGDDCCRVRFERRK